MSIECSTSLDQTGMSPPPVEPPPMPQTDSSVSSARADGRSLVGSSRSQVGKDSRPTTHDLRPPRPRRHSRATSSQTFWFWLMAGPAVLGFLLFNLGPMLVSAYLSLTRYDVVTEWRFAIGSPSPTTGCRVGAP